MWEQVFTSLSAGFLAQPADLDRAAAEAETERLDRWIEDVLRQQRRARLAA